MNNLPIELLEKICTDLSYMAICNLRITCKYISQNIDMYNYMYKKSSTLLFYHWIADGYIKQFNELHNNLYFILKNYDGRIESKIDFIRNNNIKPYYAIMIINNLNIPEKIINIKTKQDTIKHIRSLLKLNNKIKKDFF